MLTFTIHYDYIPHCKCVIFCCLDYNPDKIPYEETQDNINMKNIRYHI